MNMITSFSRRSFLWLFILTMLFVTIIDGSIYFGARYVFTRLPPDALRTAAADMPELKGGLELLWPAFEWMRVLFLPVTAGLFLLFFLVSWLVVRSIMVRVLRREGIDSPEGGKTEKAEKVKKGKIKKDAVMDESGFPPLYDQTERAPSRQEIESQHRRYYLHLLSVLQREGRLVDFLKEDLGPYSDEQVGAAVRSIHENCRKSLEKHLSPKSVMDKNEGEQVTVPADFDSSSIKLTGNVTGEPPFKGILRHRGWRAGKLELPVLTGSGDAKTIAPAEVEIV